MRIIKLSPNQVAVGWEKYKNIFSPNFHSTAMLMTNIYSGAITFWLCYDNEAENDEELDSKVLSAFTSRIYIDPSGYKFLQLYNIGEDYLPFIMKHMQQYAKDNLCDGIRILYKQSELAETVAHVCKGTIMFNVMIEVE